MNFAGRRARLRPDRRRVYHKVFTIFNTEFLVFTTNSSFLLQNSSFLIQKFLVFNTEFLVFVLNMLTKQATVLAVMLRTQAQQPAAVSKTEDFL